MSADLHRRLERLYEGAPCNAYFKPRLRVSEATAEVTIPVRPDLLHAAGAVHGSVYFKALDDAAFFAVNSLVPDTFVLTASFNIHLLRPVREGEIRAVGRVVHRTKRSFVAEAVATDSDGNEIARGTGTFTATGPALDGLGPAPKGGSAPS